MNCKIFCGKHKPSLEEDINNWLKREKIDYRDIINVLSSASEGFTTIIFLYNTLEDKKEKEVFLDPFIYKKIEQRNKGE